MSKHNKTINELESKLHEGIRYIRKLLQDVSNISFSDSMRTEIACSIATKMRVLLVDTKMCKSLLNQLGIKDKILFPIEPKTNDLASNLVFSSLLVGLRVSTKGEFYCIPQLPSFDLRLSGTFQTWFDEIVIDTKGNDFSLVSRSNVIRILSDNEGGAHEDPSYNNDYYNVVFNNGFRIVWENGEEKGLANNFFVEALFVIANEFLFAVDTFYKYIKGKLRYIKETRFNAVSISYLKDDKSLYGRRYVRNPNENINIVVQIGFDYYRKAQYMISVLREYKYVDVKTKEQIGFLVIDNEVMYPLLYLRTDQLGGIPVQAVLIKREGGFSLINKDSDIEQNTKVYPLEFYQKMLTTESATVFDEFISKQIIE